MHNDGRLQISGEGVGEKILKGRPIAPGMGFGRPCFYQEKAATAAGLDQHSRELQHQMIADSFGRLGEQLGSLADSARTLFDHNLAEIFNAHRMLIECEELQSSVFNTFMQGKLSAEDTIEKCFNDYFDYFSGLEDEYLSGRGHDFLELKRLLLNLLKHSNPHKRCRDYDGCEVGACVLKHDHVLCTGELTAATAVLIREPTRGIIAGKCGINSHAAMIARSLNIPVVSGINEIEGVMSCHDDVLVSGNTGEVIIRPTPATLERYRHLINAPSRSFDVVEPLPGYRLLADIDRSVEVGKALQVKADGIGMFRTEFELLARGHVPSEEEQVLVYSQILKQMAGKPVYIRLYDLGSDKFAPWLDGNKEDNPALGCRGARYLLQHPALLQDQARAIARASRISPVHVIYPMITTPEQFTELRTLFVQASADISGAQLQHGVMFEVPSACLEAVELYRLMDFGRIGSNDLVQFLFACDRGGNDFNYDELATHPALWRTISALSGAARACGKPLEMCGAMAANPALIPMLIEHGITTVSTRPEYIGAARRTAAACMKHRQVATPA